MNVKTKTVFAMPLSAGRLAVAAADQGECHEKNVCCAHLGFT
jgi:hypothetical protein